MFNFSFCGFFVKDSFWFKLDVLFLVLCVIELSLILDLVVWECIWVNFWLSFFFLIFILEYFFLRVFWYFDIFVIFFCKFELSCFCLDILDLSLKNFFFWNFSLLFVFLVFFLFDDCLFNSFFFCFLRYFNFKRVFLYVFLMWICFCLIFVSFIDDFWCLFF